MSHRDSLSRLRGAIEIDDALVGSKHKGKRGRGTQGKKKVLIACESRGQKAGFIAMKMVDSISHVSVDKFVRKHLMAG